MEIPTTLPREQLIPWPDLNPRKRFTDEDMKDLIASIDEVGLVQPIGVCLQETGHHYIFAGERRWRAWVGRKEEIPVYVRQLTYAQALAVALTENIQRNTLTPMEEARGIQKYIKESGETQTDVAETLGKTQSWVSNRIRLLRLHPLIQDLMDEDALSQTQARDLILPFAGLPDKKWEAFGRSLASSLSRKFGQVNRMLVDEEVRGPASKVAVAMSRWLDDFIYDYSGKNGDDSSEFAQYITVAKERWKKAPKGTVVQYLYGTNPHKRSTRAFDPDWWTEEMKQAKLARAEEEEARKAKEGSFSEELEDLEWHADLGPIPADTEVPYNQRHKVWSPVSPEPLQNEIIDAVHWRSPTVRSSGNLFADPTIIPKSCLVVQLGTGEGRHNQPTILCTDLAVFEAAQESLIAKKDAMIERRLKRQAKADVEASRAINVTKALPSVLAIGLMSLDLGLLGEAAEDLGVVEAMRWSEFEKDNLGGQDRWRLGTLDFGLALQKYLLALPPAVFLSMLKLLVYRLTRSESGSEIRPLVHIRQSVGHELRENLTRELGEMIELPSWKEAPEEESETDGEVE